MKTSEKLKLGRKVRDKKRPYLGIGVITSISIVHFLRTSKFEVNVYYRDHQYTLTHCNLSNLEVVDDAFTS